MSTVDLKSLYNKFVEILNSDSTTTPSTQSPIIEGLDEYGNVPMVEIPDSTGIDSPIPMTDQVSFSTQTSASSTVSSNATTTPSTTPIETESTNTQEVTTNEAVNDSNSTTQSEEVSTQNTTDTETKNTGAKKDEDWVKTGESIDERLTRYYAEYENASPERKLELLERYITGHYQTLEGSHSEKIAIQLADYKKLIHNTTDPQSYAHLARAIEKLERENQCPAADSILNDGATAELRKAGGIALGDALPNFHEENQIPITEKLIATQDEEIINSAAARASELHENNQVTAVELFKELNLESTENILVSQYEKFASENLIDIHNIMSTSEYESVLENILTEIEKMPEEKRQEFYDTLAEKQMEVAQETATENKNATQNATNNNAQAQQTQALAQQTYNKPQTQTENTIKNDSETPKIITQNSESRKVKRQQARRAKFKRMTTQERFTFFDKFSNRVSSSTKERICSRAITMLSPTQRQQAANGAFGSTMQKYILANPAKCNIDLEQVYASSDSATRKIIIESVQTNPFYKAKLQNSKSQLGQKLQELQQ